MSAKSIQDLYTDLNAMVANISGLNQFFMIDKSEINNTKNYKYPILVVEPPNSSMSNINKGFEDYEMVCFILSPSSKDSTAFQELALYDEAMDLFNKVLSGIAIQRGGKYVVLMDSFEFERISRVGADQVSGLKVTFNLLAPTALALVQDPPNPPATQLTHSSNLIGFYTASYGLTITANSVLWNPIQAPTVVLPMTHLRDDEIVGFDGTNLNFAGDNGFNDTDSIQIPSITFSSGSFTVLATLHVNDGSEISDNISLFSFSDDLENDYFKVLIIAGGGIDGDVQLEIRDPESLSVSTNTVIDLRPYGSPSETKTIAIVNDPSADKVYLYTEDNTWDFNTSRSDTITNSQFIFGARLLSAAYPEPYRGFYGDLRNLAIYDAALTETEARAIMTEMKVL